MADEVSRLIAGKRLAPESDRADGGGPSVVSERNYLAAARIAQKLRDAGFGCEIVSLVPTDRSRQTEVERRGRVLKGEKPGDIARVLGIAFPPTLLGRADEVIE